MAKKNETVSKHKGFEVPLAVQVTANVLNIRSTAGTEYSVRGTIIKDAVVLIDKIEKVGTVLWGRLSDKRGWICLTFTEPITFGKE